MKFYCTNEILEILKKDIEVKELIKDYLAIGNIFEDKIPSLIEMTFYGIRLFSDDRDMVVDMVARLL